jgi:cbb3-type cytochrome oxidase maturation protein
VWAVRRGQFDDLDTPAIDILADEQQPPRAREPDDAA